ncbi:zinc ribbon domain-containing protein [Paenibacillus sp. FSL K6-2862]|uniref:zinc ribbon domain-containing protein n=1 Tax=Paenibacillus sp. FSL K6-2862 TaxID=2921484 RepID=UPI0030F8A38A
MSNNFQNIIGEGLSKLQGGIEQGKQKLQTAQEINELNKHANDLNQKKSKILLDLGQLAYYKIRTGQISDIEMTELTKDVLQLDQQIYGSLRQLSQLNNSKQQGTTCEKCGNLTDGIDKYCGSCGSKVEVQQVIVNQGDLECLSCGELAPLNANHCPCCGMRMSN